MNGIGRLRRILAVGLFLLTTVSTGQAKYSGGSGTADDPYQIATAADLILLGETPDDYGEHFVMTANIDLDPNLPGRKVFDKAVIASNSSFTGVFDGKGHAVSHLTITGNDYLGLFGRLETGATVKDLGLGNGNITGSGQYVGGLVGENWGGTVTRCYGTAAVSGGSSVGGLVGYNGYGPVTQCYSTGAVSGGGSAGGLVGWNSGPVTQCYSTGAVRGSWGDVGGLVGYNGHGTVTACFWDTQTSGQATSAGGTGKTTAGMKTAKTFLDAGWDFVGETKKSTADIWWILEGKDYPRLWWELNEKKSAVKANSN